jgi:molybdopterin converting factor small subunit
MKIFVNLFGHHRNIIKSNKLRIHVNGGKVSDLLESLKKNYPQLLIDNRSHLIVVNDRPADPETGIKPGDTVSIMPFIGGG